MKDTKKILTLDGGGVRGILSLGILEHIEKLIKDKYGQGQTLADYYDLITGTSTGAIIASGLAIGKSISEIIDLYLKLGGEIFGKGRRFKLVPRSWTSFRAIFNENYNSRRFEAYLQNVFGDISIGDTERIKCGLAINAKRADTYSLWTVANHPDGKYYRVNNELKLWELCRASSAAPYYFRPKVINLHTREGVAFQAAFIDGGVSLANNPAWVSFLTATVGSFGFRWETGIEKMFITSIGTGNGSKKDSPKKLAGLRALSWSPRLADLFMIDALEMNQVILEGAGANIGESYLVDSQFSDLSLPPIFHLQEKIFSFDRHNVLLDQIELREKFNIEFTVSEVKSFLEMDHYENMPSLLEIGRKYAQNAKFNII